MKTETCCDCGNEHGYVWHCSDALWIRVWGNNDGGILCVPCFEERARELGVSLWWECAQHDYPTVHERARAQ